LGFVSGTGAVDRERRAAASVRRYRDARQPDLAWLTATAAGGRAAAQAVAGPNTHADALPSRPRPWSMCIHVWKGCPRPKSQHLHARPWGPPGEMGLDTWQREWYTYIRASATPNESGGGRQRRAVEALKTRECVYESGAFSHCAGRYTVIQMRGCPRQRSVEGLVHATESDTLGSVAS
jgi:hypothetical protein